jgi:very-short-patch-repair endonuclease
MVFKKNKAPWNKGKTGLQKHSEETKEKMSKAHKGKNIEHLKKIGFKKNDSRRSPGKPFVKGYKHSEESKQKMRKPKTEAHRLKIKENRKYQILPVKDTSIEVKIQNFLKELWVDYFTHQYMKIEHGYQCDILIPSMNLVIECDGDCWHKYPIGREIDHMRTNELLEKGFKVLRLWEFEINELTINSFRIKLQENKIMENKNE